MQGQSVTLANLPLTRYLSNSVLAIESARNHKRRKTVCADDAANLPLTTVDCLEEYLETNCSVRP